MDGKKEGFPLSQSEQVITYRPQSKSESTMT